MLPMDASRAPQAPSAPAAPPPVAPVTACGGVAVTSISAQKERLAKTETFVTIRGEPEPLREVDGRLYRADGTEYKPPGEASAPLANSGIVWDRDPHPEVYQIGDTHIFLGSQDAATNFAAFAEHGITHILNVATGVEYEKRTDVYSYKEVEMYDDEKFDIASHFEDCFAFLEEAVKKEAAVLVHCNAGVSRSATVVIAYLMKTRRLPYHEAFQTVKTSKMDIRPNDHFAEQLRSYKPDIH